MNVLIAIPVYNEQSSVIPVLTRVRRTIGADILVIDDGSTDGSGSLALSVEGVKTIRHGSNEGYGKSLMDAFARCLDCSYTHLVTMDCDEQHEPALIPQLLARSGDADIVSGTRYATASPVSGRTPRDRMEINREITLLVNELTGYSLTDAFCGFKVYGRRALQELHPTEWGYGMPLQLWVQAARAGLKIVEVPVPRIYYDADRSFGEDLDSRERRLEYYRRVIEQELDAESREDTGERAG